MAIFVSTPTSAPPAAPSLEAIDPAVIASVPGFTEELAAAMQPVGLVIDTPNKVGQEKPEVQDQSPSDLQILPAEVLRNAVGDANFALAAQAASATTAPLNPQNTTSNSEPTEDPLQDPVVLDVNNLQGAELAAANLAAQMAAAPVTPANPITPPTVQALDVTATTSIAQRADGLNTDSNPANNSIQEQASPSLAGSTSVETQASKLAMPDTAQATLEASKPTGSVQTLATSLQSVGDSSQTVLSATAPVTGQATTQVEIGTRPTSEQKPVAVNTTLAAVTTSSESLTSSAAATTPSPAQASTLTANTGASVGLATSTPTTVTTTLTQSVQANSSPAQKAATVLDSKVEGKSSVGQETAFNFDAKISAELPPVTTTPASTTVLKTSPNNDVMATSGLVQAPASTEAVVQKTVDASQPVQTEFQPAATQSLEDLSSSFVSSLVGGPQRPVNTVMDWISLQAQERPAPVVPHEVRLDAGAVQLEIQKMVKQGGGHVVMELTPPDQSKFTIELKLDEQGGALLIVEGISDSTRTRLEQSAPQLREQFQQMGLELQLDMRQQGQSASSGANAFSNSQEREPGGRDSANQGAGDTPKMLTPREAGAIRARETGANQVYLYA